MFAKYSYKKNFNTYQIFLPDVDGLIIGSPVKFMGIQVGYINQLNIVGEDIYVNFIITDKDVNIPRGSKATVEFSGLGGSKSLELYPPTPADKASSMFIIPQPPKRIHDSLGLLNDMFDKVVEIAYDVTHFIEKMGGVKLETGSKKKETANSRQKIVKNKKEKPAINNHLRVEQTPIHELLEKCNCWLDRAQKQCDKFNKKYKNKKAEKNG